MNKQTLDIFIIFIGFYTSISLCSTTYDPLKTLHYLHHPERYDNSSDEDSLSDYSNDESNDDELLDTYCNDYVKSFSEEEKNDISTFMMACFEGWNHKICSEIIRKYDKKPAIRSIIINACVPSPLIFAVINGNTRMVKILLPYVCFDTSLWNQSALFYATKMNRKRIIDALKKNHYYHTHKKYGLMYHPTMNEMSRAKTIKMFLLKSHKDCKKITYQYKNPK